jgi:hypothetical protein
MVRPSRERIQQLARELLDALARSGAVTFLKDRDAVLQAIVHAVTDELRREEERDDAARRRIGMLRNPPTKGTPAYEELLLKLIEEEYLREGLE